MKYYLNLDTEGYLLSISFTGDGPYIESLEKYNFSAGRIRAYYWDGEQLILDEKRIKQLRNKNSEQIIN